MTKTETNRGLPGCLRATIVIVAAVFAVGVGMLIWFTAWEHLDGQVQLHGSKLGDRIYLLEDCVSGDAFLPPFFGVDIILDAQRNERLRLYKIERSHTVVQSGPPGSAPFKKISAQWVLEFQAPASLGGVYTLTADTCSRFETTLGWSKAEFNDVEAVDGRLSAECTLQDGGRIVADVSFSNCH